MTRLRTITQMGQLFWTIGHGESVVLVDVALTDAKAWDAAPTDAKAWDAAPTDALNWKVALTDDSRSTA